MAGKPKNPEQRKALTFRIRMTEEERALLEEAARAAGAEASTWARSELVRLAKRLLQKK
jgi:hypothetical protein